MSTKLINYFHFRQFGVKLFGTLALIHSVVWRYKAPPTTAKESEGPAPDTLDETLPKKPFSASLKGVLLFWTL